MNNFIRLMSMKKITMRKKRSSELESSAFWNCLMKTSRNVRGKEERLEVSDVNYPISKRMKDSG